MKNVKNDETVCYDKKEIVEVLRDLNLIVVSLDRISTEYCNWPDKSPDEEVNSWLIEFIYKWKVLEKLAKARRVLDEGFSDELGEDDMGEIERECEDLKYWSKNNQLP